MHRVMGTMNRLSLCLLLCLGWNRTEETTLGESEKIKGLTNSVNPLICGLIQKLLAHCGARLPGCALIRCNSPLSHCALGTGLWLPHLI